VTVDDVDGCWLRIRETADSPSFLPVSMIHSISLSLQLKRPVILPTPSCPMPLDSITDITDFLRQCLIGAYYSTISRVH